MLIAAVGVTPASAVEPLAGMGSSGRVPLAQVDKGLRREVFAFVRAAYIDHALERADLTVISTLAFFALDAKASGHLARGPGGFESAGWAVWDSHRMTRLIDLAHEAGTRVVLTITRFSWSDSGREITVRLLSRRNARSRLVEEIVHEVVRRGVDGVNIDFEPIPSGSSDDFVSLIRELRRALDDAWPGLYLTFDATGFMGNYDVARLTAEGAADAVFIMGYPYHGTWSSHAGAMAPHSGPLYDVTDTVDAYLKRTSADKIILGVPYFGHEWSTVTRYVHSATRPKGTTYGYPHDVLLDRAMAIAAIHGRRWDRQQSGPWTRWRYRDCGSCPVTWRQLHYEDPESLGLKYDLINARDLRGAGIWSLGYERRRTALNEVLRSKFGRP